VPHFEKMLYDNAQLVPLYLEAALVSPQDSDRFAAVARDILAYVLRDMTHPEGGFYSAEDADSEGHEGKFYCWTPAELAGLLAPDEFEIVVRYFGISEEGNFVDHSHPAPLLHQNVLSLADATGSSPEPARLASAKQKMIAARAKRVRPRLDDKVLASWNGLMLEALARAYAVLGDETYLAAAEKNLAFIQARLWEAASRTLYHRWRDGERDQAQLLEGYAFLLAGVLELYAATIEPSHLDFAAALGESMLARFYDPENGGFWQSAPGGADLIVRIKEDYDGAQPAGNSVAILALLRLGRITGRGEFKEAAEKSLQLFAERLRQFPQAVPHMLQALDFSLEESRRAVVVGAPGEPATRALLRALHSGYQPNQVVLGAAGAVEPFARTLPAREIPAVYFCTGVACQPPTSDSGRIRELVR